MPFDLCRCLNFRGPKNLLTFSGVHVLLWNRHEMFCFLPPKVQYACRVTCFFLALVKLSAASEPDPSNPFVHQVGSTRKLWFHPWEADESSLNGLRASRPKGGRERERGARAGGLQRLLLAQSLSGLSSLSYMYVLTDCTYLLYIHTSILLRAHCTESLWVLGRERRHHGTYREHRKDAECSMILKTVMIHLGFHRPPLRFLR